MSFLRSTWTRVRGSSRISYPESECNQSRLNEATMLDMLSVNQVVKGKVEQECQRVLSLVAACLTDGAGKAIALEELKVQRAVLKHKTMALSDLLAVFRAARQDAQHGTPLLPRREVEAVTQPYGGHQEEHTRTSATLNSPFPKTPRL